ncbi:MAG: tetratricopeptide repeat protein [Holophagaceae bacterium]|nr:tetratricopeptide repeat protein [Holophagaceae bacterium]
MTKAAKKKTAANPYVQGIINAAYNQQKLGNRSQAEVLYNQVLKEEPGNPFALYGLGALALNGGQMPKAVELLQAAIVNGYREATAYSHLGIALQTSGRLDEALEVYAAGLKKYPKDPSWVNNTSVVLAQKGDLEGALKESHLVIKNFPKDPRAYLNAGQYLTELTRYDEAEGMFRKVLELEPGHLQATAALVSVGKLRVDAARK